MTGGMEYAARNELTLVRKKGSTEIMLQIYDLEMQIRDKQLELSALWKDHHRAIEDRFIKLEENIDE